MFVLGLIDLSILGDRDAHLVSTLQMCDSDSTVITVVGVVVVVVVIITVVIICFLVLFTFTPVRLLNASPFAAGDSPPRPGPGWQAWEPICST
jgi:hypothetical protein